MFAGHLGPGQVELTAPLGQHYGFSFFSHRPTEQLTIAQSVPSGSTFAGVARARLDNLEAVKRRLGLPAPADLEQVISHGFRSDQERFPDALLGEFSLAVFDQANHTLWCARDAVGVFPFFYCQAGESFFFASHLEALLAIPAVPVEVDEETIARFLQHHHFFRPQATFFRHIKRLPAGHALALRGCNLKITRYFRPDEIPAVQLPSEADYVHLIHTTVEKAVARRATGAAHLGTHLSGGLDSSLLTVFAAQANPKKLTGFSWSFPPPDGDEALPAEDERSRVLALAKRLEIGCEFTVRYAHEIRHHLLQDPSLERSVMTHTEEPVARRASELGVQVILSGWGGDEFLSSNGRGVLARQLLRGRLLEVFRECRAAARRNASTIAREAWARVLPPLLPDALYRRRYPNQTGKTFIDAEFAARMPVEEPMIRDHIGLRENMLQLWRLGHLGQRVESWAAQGQPLGIVYRYPLLDRQVVELAFALPETLFFRAGFSRYIFRKFAEPMLGSDWAWGRPKHEVTPLQFRKVPNLDPSPGLVRDSVQALAEAPPHHYIDWKSLLASWEDPTVRGELRSRALQMAFLNPQHRRRC